MRKVITSVITIAFLFSILSAVGFAVKKAGNEKNPKSVHEAVYERKEKMEQIKDNIDAVREKLKDTREEFSSGMICSCNLLLSS
jgi:peptidoglycan hydrolase CwlO-like protein